MTRRVRLWTTAVLSIAAMALTIGLSIAAQAGAHTPTHAAGSGCRFITDYSGNIVRVQCDTIA
jgi:hypothetical protein